MIGPPLVAMTDGLGMSQKLKKKIAVLQELDDNALPSTKPQKETTYAKKIRNIVAAEAVTLEQKRRLTGESLFSVENVAYSWKEALSVAQHKMKRGDHPKPVPASSSSSSSSKGNVNATEPSIHRSVSEPQTRRSSSLESNNVSSSGKSNRPSFDSQTSGKSNRPSFDSQTSSSSGNKGGGVDSNSNNNHLPTSFHRKSFPHEEAMKLEKTHEEALKRSVEQVMAQPQQPLSDVLIRTIHDSLPTTTTTTTTTQPPNSHQPSQKPPSTRVRRDAYDPVAVLSSLQATTAAGIAATIGTTSILDRVRTLQHSQKLRKSFEIVPSTVTASVQEVTTEDPLHVSGHIPFLSAHHTTTNEDKTSSDPKHTEQDRENNGPGEVSAVLSSFIPNAAPAAVAATAAAVSSEQTSCGELKWENTPWGPMLVSASEKLPDKPPTNKQTAADKRKKTRSMDFTPLSELFPKKPPPVVAPPVVEQPTLTAIQRNIAAVSSANIAAAVAAAAAAAGSSSAATTTGVVPNPAHLNTTTTTDKPVVSSSSRLVKAQSEKLSTLGRPPPHRILRASFQLDYNMAIFKT